MRYPVLVSLLPVSVLVAATACSPSGNTGAPNDATVPLETPARPKPRPIARGAAPQAPAEPAVDSKARPRPTSVKTFGAWGIACDNGAYCTAVSMAPDDSSIAELSIEVERSPAADAPVSVTIGTPGSALRRVVVAIDGTPLASGNPGDDRRFTVTGPVAMTLAKRLATGTAMTARLDGRTIPVVITGAAAALRYADAQQGRAGTATALVAIGDKAPATTLPALPTILAAPLTDRRAQAPAAPLVAQMRQRTGCAADQFGPVTNETHALDATTDLVLLSCGSGAYNVITRALIVRDGKASEAPFDLPPQFGEPGAKPALVNAGYDPKTGLLSSYAKGRGIGDCGVGQDYVWDGTRFRLAEMRMMGECRGAITWPVTWRTTVARN